MRKSLFCLAGGVIACGLSLHVHAVEKAAAVLVTATRTAQLADEVLAPMVEITREDIERIQPGDVADLLRFHAGFDIGRNGGPGQATSLFLRGTNSDHTLVMIDGVRINPGTLGGAAIQNLDPALIERIEIVKGPRSSLYGSDAIGGVVNIITRRGAEGTNANVSAGAGSFGTRKFTAGVQHARGGLRFGVDAAVQSTDGFSPRTDSDIDRGHDNTSFNARAGQRFGAVDVELSHFQARGNTEYLDFFLSPVDQDFLNSVTALRIEANPVAQWATRLQLSRAKDEIDQKQDADFAHTDRKTVDWQNDVQIGAAQLLTAGVALTREEASSLVFGSGFDEEIEIKEAYIQDAIDLGAHRWLFAARHTDHEAFGGHTTWDAEYGHQLSDATRLTLAAGTAFRAPDATDRFGFGGDPDLEPEESRNIELGLRHRLSSLQRLSLSLFQNDIDNLIWSVCDEDFNCQMVNLREARIRGVEAGYDYASGSWRAGVEAIVQDPRNETTGDPMPRRAKRSLTASLGYDGGRYQLGADLLATSRRKDSDFSSTSLAGYGLVNLTAALVLAPDWTLRARVENLFDKDYTLASGYNTADRGYFLQVAWQYPSSGGGL